MSPLVGCLFPTLSACKSARSRHLTLFTLFLEPDFLFIISFVKCRACLVVEGDVSQASDPQLGSRLGSREVSLINASGFLKGYELINRRSMTAETLRLYWLDVLNR